MLLHGSNAQPGKLSYYFKPATRTLWPTQCTTLLHVKVTTDIRCLVQYYNFFSSSCVQIQFRFCFLFLFYFADYQVMFEVNAVHKEVVLHKFTSFVPG